MIRSSTVRTNSFACGVRPCGWVRGRPGDGAKFHQSNALHLEPVIRAIDMPFVAIERSDDIPRLATAYRHSRTLSRPVVVGFTREVLRGEA